MWLDHDWKKARSYAANVTLDPDTAYFELFVSEDHRSVKRKNTRQDLPEKPGRFFLDPCVLGHEAFSSGRHYWEVEVGDRAYWELGVCEENIQRTWGITESPQNGFWAVELYADKYQALTSPRTLLPLSEPPRRVGIFLDYEAGDVSFYSVSDRSHIFTFPQASFSGAVRPFFCLWFYHPTPLTICP
ncbi:butyrophilin subfamily 1 member A1-like [Loxodonta africana]|uniref:butyrophilin subfamily 1 member A1-like n=1 Tax=Loxodonta africana TaxID=9785 RepID=UPI0030D0D495